MRLQPDGKAFKSCYPDWDKDVATLIASDTSQATFGISGRWGAGKSSACSAIKDALIEISTTRERYIGIVDLNLLDIQQGTVSERLDTETRTIIGREKKGPKLTKEQTKIIANLFGKLGGAISAIKAQGLGLDPATSKAAGGGVEAAASASVERILEPLTSNSPSLSSGIEEIIAGDQIVFFLDDLDRCYPDKAISFLALAGEEFSRINPKIKFNLVIACDPEVLARHAAHVFGISLTEGLEAISKYIHVPLHLPIAATKNHRLTITPFLPKKYRDNHTALSIIEQLIGVVPMREILTALPQAFIWHERFLTKNTKTGDTSVFLRYFVCWSLIAINMPSVLRYSIKDTEALGMAGSLFAVKPLSEQDGSDKILARFGAVVQEAVRLRPDLCHVARSLVNDWSSSEMKAAIQIIGQYDLGK